MVPLHWFPKKSIRNKSCEFSVREWILINCVQLIRQCFSNYKHISRPKTLILFLFCFGLPPISIRAKDHSVGLFFIRHLFPPVCFYYFLVPLYLYLPFCFFFPPFECMLLKQMSVTVKVVCCEWYSHPSKRVVCVSWGSLSLLFCP